MKQLSIIIVCFLVTNAVAGGSFHPIQVTDLAIGKNGISFVLKAVTLNEPRAWMDQECKSIVVKGTYDSKKWKKYKRPMSLQLHLESLSFLKQSKQSKNTVMFGYIGRGLIENEKCNYSSKGLFIQNNTIFSVNGHI